MIKQNLLKSLVALFLLSGCTDGQDIYEKSISSFVQTNKRGTWTDLKFEVIDMSKPIDITVGDSIRLLTEKFDKDKATRLALLSEGIERNMKNRDRESSSGMKDFYQEMIDERQVMVDSISKMVIVLPEAYQNKLNEQVLAKEVVCKFSITPPAYHTRQEMTKTFILNADGSTCLRMKSK